MSNANVWHIIPGLHGILLHTDFRYHTQYIYVCALYFEKVSCFIWPKWYYLIPPLCILSVTLLLPVCLYICLLDVFCFVFWLAIPVWCVCVFVCYKKGRNTQHLLRLDYICQVQTKYKTPYCLSCHCQTICFHLVCIRCSSCLKMTQLVFI